MEEDKVKLSSIKKIIENIEQTTQLSADEIEISFEFICASLFPTIYSNIREAMAKEYIKGFKEGNSDTSIEIQKPINNEVEQVINNIINYNKLSLNEINRGYRVLNNNINSENYTNTKILLDKIHILLNKISEIN